MYPTLLVAFVLDAWIGPRHPSSAGSAPRHDRLVRFEGRPIGE